MSELSKILKEEYTKKERIVTPASLLEMIEEIMELPIRATITEKETRPSTQPKTLTIDLIPTLPITEIGWGSLATPEKGGKEVRTSAGQDLAQFLNNIAPGGDMRDKIVALNEYYSDPVPEETGPPGEQISRTISNLVFYKTLTNIITNFNASSAGFAFESFLAVLLDAETGKQIPASAASTIADIVVEKGGRPISLKLYKEGQLKVGGSYKQLVEDLMGKYPVMEYIVVTKDLSGSGLEQEGLLNFYGFNFTRDNFIEILALKAKEIELMRLPKVFRDPVEELEARLQEAGDLRDFLTVPAATYVNLEPIIGGFVDMVNDLATARGIDPAKINIADELDNIIDMKTGELLANPKNRFGYFQGGKFPRKILKQMISQMNLEGNEPQLVVAIIDDAYGKAVKARQKAGGAGAARKEKFRELAFMTPRQSLKRLIEIQNTGSDELFATAMKSTEGYLRNKQFELAKGDLAKMDTISNQDNLYPYGEFSIGTIEIGASKIQAMLDASIGDVNNAIFAIFSDLKDLSGNLNAYVAGGLQNDSLAAEAKDDAENIATGTEEIRNTDK